MGELKTTTLVYDELFKTLNYKNGGMLTQEEIREYFTEFMGLCKKGHENNSFNGSADYKGEECYQVKDEVVKEEVKCELKEDENDQFRTETK